MVEERQIPRRKDDKADRMKTAWEQRPWREEKKEKKVKVIQVD